MTYCVAIALDDGLVFCSDSRTNAGVDQISTYSKMFQLTNRQQQRFVVLSAGNLATTQAVIAKVKKDLHEAQATGLNQVTTLHEAAEYLGELNRNEQQKHNQGNASTFEASFILGGQLPDENPQIMMIYPQGNYITTSSDTPYLQIGESKYGKPILDRILHPETSLDTAALCALVSMDSTMRSNLTVGPPIELITYQSSNDEWRYNRFEKDDEYLRDLKRAWDARIAEAFEKLPAVSWKAEQTNK